MRHPLSVGEPTVNYRWTTLIAIATCLAWLALAVLRPATRAREREAAVRADDL